MEFNQILAERWSCREFEDREVPEATLREMFTLAQRTASWCNTQPWTTYLLSGQARERLAKALVESVIAGGGGADLPMPEKYVGVYQDRRRGAGYALYESLGIAREDREARDAQMLKNFSFFGAPHVAIVVTDANQGTYGAIDCGGYVANLLNAAHSLGVATIPQAAVAMQSPVVREVLDLPADQLVVCAVSIGYAVADHPVNQFRTSRASVDDAVVFVR
ncbi:nitroreductase [Nocardioides sp. AE5]|uniref:nitroreductase n=1 Tax=Nocardioides sp. AE5 TaxID=2962573 RepID=UPI0028813D28|nr:nitroreductase [Nocardioides sp. AE5]MDT0203241.1 nitroreductase [Nocardioides sp. AE5]